MITEGDIYWFDGFPPLDGLEAKRRAAVVIETYDNLSPIVVVVVGITSDLDDPAKIEIPNTTSEPDATTGL